MTRKAKTYLFVVGGAIVALIGVPVWFILGPPRALVVSQETTHLTEPLDAEGQVDYVAAVLQRQRAGVTPENNAAIPLLQAMWPWELEPEDQRLICDELQMTPPSSDGMTLIADSNDYQEKIIAWASEKWGVDLSDEEQYDFNPAEYIYDAMDSPWRRKQIPPLAQWVDEHAGSLALLHEMESRDAYYFPSPSRLASDATLMSGGIPDASLLRDVARALSTRAMMHLGEGEPRLAWRDLRLIIVLTRMSWADSSTVHAMVAYAIEGIATSAFERLLSSGQCDEALLDEMEAFWASLPPPADMTPITDQHDRWAFLEYAATTPTDELDSYLYFGDDERKGPIWLLQLPLDKNTLLRRLNQRYNELVAVMSLQDPAQFAVASDKFKADVENAVEDWHSGGATAAAVLSQSVRGIYAADLLVDGLISSQTVAKQPQYRVEATEQLLRIAIALEKYRLQSGEYPVGLSQLTKSLDPALFEDPYAAGQQLRYERRGEGFLLYSRFENGLDDGGNSIGSEIHGGEWANEGEVANDYPAVDLVFRFPIQPLVLAKPKTVAEQEREYYGEFADEMFDEEESTGEAMPE